jgi:hypothetical protein
MTRKIVRPAVTLLQGRRAENGHPGRISRLDNSTPASVLPISGGVATPSLVQTRSRSFAFTPLPRIVGWAYKYLFAPSVVSSITTDPTFWPI